MRGGDEQVLDEVLFLGARADHALAAAALRAVRRDLLPLDVAGVRDRDHHVLLLDRCPRSRCRLPRPRSAVRRSSPYFSFRRAHLVLDDRRASSAGSRGSLCSCSISWMTSRYSCLDLLALEAGEALQAHLEDRVGLDLGELERASSGRCARSRRPSTRGSARSPASRWSSAILRPSRMCARFSASARSNSVRRRTTICAVRDVLVEQRAQRQHLRPVVHQRQHDRAERGLQRRVHEQLVQHDLRVARPS